MRTLPRNDPRQYDDLAEQWWDTRGGFAMLHWIAEARARLVPPATRPGALLLDLACGAGLLAPHIAGRGYRHVGLDLSALALVQARDHGVVTVRGDVMRLPFADEVADVVVAGEVLEHVPDLRATVSEACRALRPGGTLVVDTIADTWFGRFCSITVGERLPAGPPKNLHDPDLYVDRDELIARRLPMASAQFRDFARGAVDHLRWLVGGASACEHGHYPIHCGSLPGLGTQGHGRMSAAIIGHGHALPPAMSQQGLWEGFFRRHYRDHGLARTVWEHSGITTRRGVVDPTREDISTWGTGARMRRFATEALPLGRDAVGKAFAAAGSTRPTSG